MRGTVGSSVGSQSNRFRLRLMNASRCSVVMRPECFAVKVPQPGALGLTAPGRKARSVIVRMMMHQIVGQVAVPDRTKVCQPDAHVAVGGADQGLIETARLQQLLQSDKTGWSPECGDSAPGVRPRPVSAGCSNDATCRPFSWWMMPAAAMSSSFFGEKTGAAFQVVRRPGVIVIQHRDQCRRGFRLQPHEGGVDGRRTVPGVRQFSK